ncbi:MAG: 50S ribosome-binding GTPase, partial [Thermoguttaceae bacterium]|nr:50S ribosome-binding GTPase [Thermoguttaceae bacterium]
NKLTGRKISYVSKKAGKTKYLNYFLIDDDFYLVDAPGYGSTNYATLSTAQFSGMMESILPDDRLVGIVLLLDLRRDMGKDDLAFLRYLQDSGKPIVPILTKVDLMNQSEKSKAKRRAGEAGLYDPILSDGTDKALGAIKKAIDNLL